MNDLANVLNRLQQTVDDACRRLDGDLNVGPGGAL